MNIIHLPLICFFIFVSLLLNPGHHALGKNELSQPQPLGNVTIFIYHKFGEDKYPTTNVSVEKFAKQLQYLKENNFTVLSLKSLVELLESRKIVPEKTAVLTIDDGYTSTYTEAWPLLKEYGYSFTVFLYVKAVEQKYRNFLTWDQVKEMQLAGVDFQDHSYSHHRFGDIPAGMDDTEYKNWVFADLLKGNQILEKRLGYRPEFLALPYGEYNTIIQKEARELGYKAVFSQDPGSVSRYTDIYAIPREPILGNDWSTVKHFAKVLDRKDLPIENVFPHTEPLIDLQPKNFCATIVEPHLYLQDSFGIYVSELGWQKGQLTGDRLCIENNTTLQRRSNRVAINAKEKEGGSTAMRYWLLIRK